MTDLIKGFTVYKNLNKLYFIDNAKNHLCYSCKNECKDRLKLLENNKFFSCLTKCMWFENKNN